MVRWMWWFFFSQFCSRFFEGGSCPPRELLTCWITLSILIPDNLNPALVCLGCMLQQELENWEMYAEKSWDVDVQNGGWCYLDVFVNKQIHLIKAGCPWRFLPLSAHPPFSLQLWGLQGTWKAGLEMGISDTTLHMVQLLLVEMEQIWRKAASLQHGIFVIWWGVSVQPSANTIPSTLQPWLPAQRRTSLLLLQRGWHTNTLLPHWSTHLTFVCFGPTSYIIELEGKSPFSGAVQPSSVTIYIAGWLTSARRSLQCFSPTRLPAECLTLRQRKFS